MNGLVRQISPANLGDGIVADRVAKHGNRAHAISGILQRIVDSVDDVLLHTVDALFTWQQRLIDRSTLLGFDDHMLRDIGLSRFDVEHEAGKPFWRA